MLLKSSYLSEARWLTIKHGKHIMLVGAMVFIVPLALFGVAAPVQAAPSGIFPLFGDCPLVTFRALGVPPGRALCGFHQITSGELAIGSMRVPIEETITLQGGFTPTGNPENEQEFFVLSGANGESLSKTELNVPGGLPDFVKCEEITGNGIPEIIERGRCKALFENKATVVTATMEGVASASNPGIFNGVALGFEEGTGLTLPVRIHLKNPLLGNQCYIGSESQPIELHLTTGETHPNPPNKPIHGTNGKERVLVEYERYVAALLETSLVDNSFSAPAAEGCGEFFSFLIDPLVDGKVKLPSEDGNNTAILTGTGYVATAESVEIVTKYLEETEAKKKQEEAEAKKKQEAEAKKRQEELEAERKYWGHRTHWQRWWSAGKNTRR